MKNTPDFPIIWEWAIKTAVAIILEVVVIIIGNLPGYCTAFQVPCWALAIFFCVSSFLILLGIVQVAWLGIKRANYSLKRWKQTPSISPQFVLQGENDLRLRIHNKNRSKEVYVELWQKDFLTIRGKKYIHEYPNELSIVRDSRGSGFPLYTGTLTPNDTIEIKVGFPHDNKISLRILGDDSPIYKFRDGRFEYVVSCKGKYQGSSFALPEISIWLTIKDGRLAKISDEL